MKNILYWVGVVVGSFILTYVLGALGYAFIYWEAPPWDISEWEGFARTSFCIWSLHNAFQFWLWTRQI